MSRFSSQRGSALMLAPAGVLVLMVLGAISVDSAVAFSAQRELSSQASAAVNDAATLSLDGDQLQRGVDAQMDPIVAERVIRNRLSAVELSGLHVTPEDIAVSVDNAAGTVSVVVEGDADYIFAKAVPGARDQVHVRASATAQLQHRAG